MNKGLIECARATARMIAEDSEINLNALLARLGEWQINKVQFDAVLAGVMAERERRNNRRKKG